MQPEEIIKRPIVTERSSSNIEEGKYTFEVDKNANKIQIAKAVESIFNVKVLNVNTVTVRGKNKRVGANQGKTSDWKKAIVTIDKNPGEESYLGKGGKAVKLNRKYKDSIDEFTA